MSYRRPDTDHHKANILFPGSEIGQSYASTLPPNSVTNLPSSVGVGAQIGADLTCDNCKADQENYCPNTIDTYGAPYPDGTIAQGGYASHMRAHEYFTFKIPDGIPTELAAPMVCSLSREATLREC